MNDVRKNRIREAMETVLKAFESNPEKVAHAIFWGNTSLQTAGASLTD
ncbi:hypothetical protein [Archaeoglobus sp.]